MNFWQFLDHNGEGVALAIVLCVCFGFASCDEGCHGRTGSGCRIQIDSAPLVDGGTPEGERK